MKDSRRARKENGERRHQGIAQVGRLRGYLLPRVKHIWNQRLYVLYIINFRDGPASSVRAWVPAVPTTQPTTHVITTQPSIRTAYSQGQGPGGHGEESLVFFFFSFSPRPPPNLRYLYPYAASSCHREHITHRQHRNSLLLLLGERKNERIKTRNGFLDDQVRGRCKEEEKEKERAHDQESSSETVASRIRTPRSGCVEGWCQPL